MGEGDVPLVVFEDGGCGAPLDRVEPVEAVPPPCDGRVANHFVVVRLEFFHCTHEPCVLLFCHVAPAYSTNGVNSHSPMAVDGVVESGDRYAK